MTSRDSTSLKIVVLFVFVCLSGSISFAQKNNDLVWPGMPKNPETIKILADGLRRQHNGDYDGAKELFERYVKLEPKDPVGLSRKLSNEYLLLRKKDKTDEPKINDPLEYARLITSFDKGIELTELKIKNGEDLDFYLFVQQFLYSFKGAFEKSNGHWGGSLDSAHKVLELGRTSRYQDAQYLSGFLIYQLSRRSWWEKLLLSAPKINLPSDRKAGLLMMAAAVKDNDNPFVDDIWFVIFNILTDEKVKEKDRTKAAKIMNISAEEAFNRLFPKYSENESLQKYLKKKR